jgi:hypothetical protein
MSNLECSPESPPGHTMCHIHQFLNGTSLERDNQDSKGCDGAENDRRWLGQEATPRIRARAFSTTKQYQYDALQLATYMEVPWGGNWVLWLDG